MAPTLDTSIAVKKRRKPSASLKIFQPTCVESLGGISCHICSSVFKNKQTFEEHYKIHNAGNTETIYTCVVCKKEIDTYNKFRAHCYTQHVLKEKARCQHCQKCFSKTAALQEHIDLKHKNKCSVCKKEFASQKELQLHQIIHNEDSPLFPCHDCKDKIETLEDCENHVQKHSKYKYTCPICCKKNTSKETAVSHISIHFDEHATEDMVQDGDIVPEDSCIEILGILCNHCNKNFNNRSEFDSHFLDEHGDVIYSCNVCGSQFEEYLSFSNHCYNHLMKSKFKCTKCERSFDRLSRLVNHVEAHHNNTDPKAFSCTECDYTYFTEERLRLHLREVHDEYSLRCPDINCKKTFKTMQEFVIHKKSHKTVSNNWCRQCGLQFETLANCIAHLDVHRENSYFCPICSKNTNTKYIMSKHILVHFEQALHVCKLCGKAYNRKHRLVEHIKTHSQKKSHVCSQCGKIFLTMQNLNQHLNLHSALKPYECNICKKTFNFISNRSQHLRRVHNIDPKTYNTNEKANIKSIVQIVDKPNDGNIVRQYVFKNQFIDETKDSGNNLIKDTVDEKCNSNCNYNETPNARIKDNKKLNITEPKLDLVDSHSDYEYNPGVINNKNNMKANIDSICSIIPFIENEFFGNNSGQGRDATYENGSNNYNNYGKTRNGKIKDMKLEISKSEYKFRDSYADHKYIPDILNDQESIKADIDMVCSDITSKENEFFENNSVQIKNYNHKIGSSNYINYGKIRYARIKDEVIKAEILKSKYDSVNSYADYEFIPDIINDQESIKAGIDSMCSEITSKDNELFGENSNEMVELDSINPTITADKGTVDLQDNVPTYADFTDVLPQVAEEYPNVIDPSTPIMEAQLVTTNVTPQENADTFVFVVSDESRYNSIDMNDMLPSSIESLVIINSGATPQQAYVQDYTNNNFEPSIINMNLGYETLHNPIITKINQNYQFSYGDDSSNRFTVMNE